MLLTSCAPFSTASPDITKAAQLSARIKATLEMWLWVFDTGNLLDPENAQIPLWDVNLP